MATKVKSHELCRQRPTSLPSSVSAEALHLDNLQSASAAPNSLSLTNSITTNIHTNITRKCLYGKIQKYQREGGTWWRSWLRHRVTSQEVASSIPDGIFHRHNPSGRTMALGLRQPLTEMSTRNISWGVKAAGRRTDNLTTFMCRLSWNIGASSSWNPQGLSRLVQGLLYLLPDRRNCTSNCSNAFTKESNP